MNIETSEKFLKNMNILYIESDESFSNEVNKALKIKSNYVYHVKTIAEAKKLIKKIDFDILITEIDIKDGNGLELIEYFNTKFPNTQIIVISSVIKVNILLECIKLNLIDYIIKPIKLRRLREALKIASLNRFNNGTYEIYFEGNVKYNYRKKLLTNNKKVINLTHNEISLLDCLILNQHCIMSIENIKNIVWEDAYFVSDVAFKSLLSRLRTKIGKKTIQNISGSGYCLKIRK